MNLVWLVCVCQGFPANRTSFNASHINTRNVTKSIWKKPLKNFSGFVDITTSSTLLQLKREETSTSNKELEPSPLRTIATKSTSTDVFITRKKLNTGPTVFADRIRDNIFSRHVKTFQPVLVNLPQEPTVQNEPNQSMLGESSLPQVHLDLPSPGSSPQVIPEPDYFQIPKDIPDKNALDLPSPAINPQFIPQSGPSSSPQDIPDSNSNPYNSQSSSIPFPTLLVVGLLMGVFVVGAIFVAIRHVKVVRKKSIDDIDKGSIPNLLDNARMAISAPQQSYRASTDSVVDNGSKSKLSR
jgi:hypothetical protein